MMSNKYDIIIAGAGPAGCACAYMLRNSGLQIALIDKATFPRDKICGDALSADVANQLGWMDEKLLGEFSKFSKKITSNGIRLFAPDHKFLDVELSNIPSDKHGGYVAKRKDFDNFLFNQVKKLSNIDIYQGEKIINVITTKASVVVYTTSNQIEGEIIVGADGANSIVKRKLTNQKLEKKHYCIGLRQYYKNVSDFHPKNHIELHFYKDLLPGYFWIFPLPNNQANIGIGMLSSIATKKKVNLKNILQSIINSHPNIKQRFKHAEPIESVRGFGLPIGSKKRSISGERFLLLGDAASLIDPFSGEGIANAIRSGRVAAYHLIEAVKKNDYSGSFNKLYDKEIYRRMWNELKLSRSLQMLLKYPSLFNFVANKAIKNKSVQMLINSMLNNIDLKKELLNPRFYFKLLFSSNH